MKKLCLVCSVFLLSVLTSYFLHADTGEYKVNLIELSPADFPDFGIIAGRTSYNLIFSDSAALADDRGEFKKAKNRKLIIYAGKIETRNVKRKEADKASKLAPNLIVVKSKNRSAAYYNNIADYLKTLDEKKDVSAQANAAAQLNVDNWVAFHFTANAGAAREFDVYLWYDKTEWLKKNVPDSLKDEIANVPNPENTNTVFGNAKVYPNPVQNGNANLSFEISESRTAAIRIFDINGGLVLTVAENIGLSPGTHEQPLQLDGLSSGMYLLVITTDRKERIVTRIIVINN